MPAFVTAVAAIAATVFLALIWRNTMALRQSTLDIIAGIQALQADDRAKIDAAVQAASAELQAKIDSDAAEDIENADAIKAALDASPLTPNADDLPPAEPAAA